MLVQDALEALRCGLGLAPRGLVALGELEQALDGILARLALDTSLLGDKVGVLDCTGIGRVLSR